jgi:hypothetical protein
MKHLLTIICLFLVTNTFAQNSADTTKPKVTGYLSIGLSVTNSSDFLTSSYTGLEGGIMYRDFGTGLVFGRGSLRGLGSDSDDITNYFVEGKVSYSHTFKMVTFTPFFGYGGYINTKHKFIEYGIGASYTIKNISIGVAFSNWDETNYLTPNITYNF